MLEKILVYFSRDTFNIMFRSDHSLFSLSVSFPHSNEQASFVEILNKLKSVIKFFMQHFQAGSEPTRVQEASRLDTMRKLCRSHGGSIKQIPGKYRPGCND